MNADKIPILNDHLRDGDVGIGFISETWHDDQNRLVLKNSISRNYHILSVERKGKRGGGVMILANKSFTTRCAPIPLATLTPPAWSIRAKAAKAKAKKSAEPPTIPRVKGGRINKRNKSSNPPDKPDEDDEPIKIEIKMARLFPHKLPRGFSSVIAVCVYVAEFAENGPRQNPPSGFSRSQSRWLSPTAAMETSPSFSSQATSTGPTLPRCARRFSCTSSTRSPRTRRAISSTSSSQTRRTATHVLT